MTFIECPSFDYLKELIAPATAQDCVVWDVDGTLTYPQDSFMLLLLSNRFLNLQEKYEKQLDEAAKKHFSKHEFNLQYSLSILEIHHALIHEEIPQFIAQLQKNKIPCCALTAMEFRIDHLDLATWRVNYLRNLGIDFAQSIPALKDKNIFDHFNEIRPGFMEGILFSARHSKGDVLMTFLKSISWTPRHIFFIDDYMPYLEAMHKALEAEKISHTCIYFRHLDSIHFEQEELIWQKQIDFLHKHKKFHACHYFKGRVP